MKNERVYGVFSEKAIAEIVAEEIRMEKLDRQYEIEQNRIHNGCCPRHGERISYGMFDAVCGACEYESDTGEAFVPYVRMAPWQGPIQQPGPNPDPDDILF